jgi:hypothetical protein
VVEQNREGVAEAEAAPAAVADVKNTLEFAVERGVIAEFRTLPVENVTRWGVEAALAGSRRRALAHARRSGLRTGLS